MPQPDLLEFANGEKVRPTFSAGEMENRVAKLRGAIKAARGIRKFVSYGAL